MTHLRSIHRAKGFTLMELMTTLVLVVVLLAWGVPNYQSLKNQRMVTDFSNEIIYSLSLARAEAIRYGSNVEVRPRGGDWQDGWQTIVTGVDGSPNQTIAVQGPVDRRLTIKQEGNLQGKLVFNNFGGLESDDEGLFTLTSNMDGTKARAIRINLVGQAKVLK